MKRSGFSLNFSVGFVVFVATLIVVGGMFLVGDGVTLFGDQVTYEVLFPSVGGLRPGSRVYLGGVFAGSVKGVKFPSDLKINRVLKKFAHLNSAKITFSSDLTYAYFFRATQARLR